MWDDLSPGYFYYVQALSSEFVFVRNPEGVEMQFRVETCMKDKPMTENEVARARFERKLQML